MQWDAADKHFVTAGKKVRQHLYNNHDETQMPLNRRLAAKSFRMSFQLSGSASHACKSSLLFSGHK